MSKIDWDRDFYHEEQMHQARVEENRRRLVLINAREKLGPVLQDEELKKHYSNVEIWGMDIGRLRRIANKYGEAIQIIEDAYDGGDNLTDETRQIRASVLSHYNAMNREFKKALQEMELHAARDNAVAQYDKLAEIKNNTRDEDELARIAEQFRLMAGYKDADLFAGECDAIRSVLIEKREEEQRIQEEKRAAKRKAAERSLRFFAGIYVIASIGSIIFAIIFPNDDARGLALVLISLTFAVFYFSEGVITKRAGDSNAGSGIAGLVMFMQAACIIVLTVFMRPDGIFAFVFTVAVLAVVYFIIALAASAIGSRIGGIKNT